MSDAATVASVLTDHRVWAVVGCSPDPYRDSHRIAALLQSRGYRVIPVNPAVDEVLGERAYPSLREIPASEGVEVVDVFRRSELAGAHVDEAIEIGARAVWLQLGVVDEAAARRARAAGLQVVMDRCPAIELPRLAAAGSLSHPVRIGCSGWNYRDWRGPVYPPGCPTSRWLAHYARTFDTVEVNSTFYRLASRDAVARWVRDTPDDFLFTLKASRFITHMKRLTDMGEPVRRYYERVEPLLETPKLGPVLWQLPESFKRDDDRLAAALAQLPPGRHAFELRHESWFAEPVYQLLRHHGVALAVGDDVRRPWVPLVVTAPWTFLRFHYGARGRRGNYSDAELREWAARIADLRTEVEVLAYFNNDWEAFAPRNAVRLRRLLEQASGPLRPGHRC